MAYVCPTRGASYVIHNLMRGWEASVNDVALDVEVGWAQVVEDGASKKRQNLPMLRGTLKRRVSVLTSGEHDERRQRGGLRVAVSQSQARSRRGCSAAGCRA
jgi:hypothetical protein